MSIQYFDSIEELFFETKDDFDFEQAKEYANKKLLDDRYKDCSIGSIYVNGVLVLTNIRK